MIPVLQELKRRGKIVILILSHEKEGIINEICERLGIIKIIYENIRSHRSIVRNRDE